MQPKRKQEAQQHSGGCHAQGGRGKGIKLGEIRALCFNLQVPFSHHTHGANAPPQGRLNHNFLLLTPN